MGTSYVLLLYHLQAQLLLTGYKQPGRDVSGSHNGQIGAQTSPLDDPIRCREVPTKFPFTGHLRGTRPARQRSCPPRSGGLR